MRRKKAPLRSFRKTASFILNIDFIAKRLLLTCSMKLATGRMKLAEVNWTITGICHTDALSHKATLSFKSLS